MIALRNSVRMQRFDSGGTVVGPYGLPQSTPGGIPQPGDYQQQTGALGSGSAAGVGAGSSPQQGALGTSMGAGSGTSGTQTSGPNMGALGSSLGLSGRDIAATAAGIGLGVVGTAIAGPIGGLLGNLAGKYGVGALIDYFDPPTVSHPTVTMEPTAQVSVDPIGGGQSLSGAGLGGLAGTQAGALNNMGSITGNPADMANPNTSGPDVTGGDVNSGNPGENVSGSGLHARGGRIRRKKKTGALTQFLGARR